MDGQCSKLMTVVDHQFITLTVDISVQHGGREVLRHAGLSVAAETCITIHTVRLSYSVGLLK